MAKQKSSALIIALLIVSVLGTMILALGRQIIQNTFSTNRYADEMSARSIAWAGIEDGLAKLKQGFYNYDLKNTEPSATRGAIIRVPKTTLYYPNFSENILDFSNNLLFSKVYRRNLTERTQAPCDLKEQIAGVFCTSAGAPFSATDPSACRCNLWNNVGMSSNVPIEDSCAYKRNDKDVNPNDANFRYENNLHFAWCDPDSWKISDSYYDLRISGSDDKIGNVFSTSGGNRNYRMVNLGGSDQFLDTSTSYYAISRANNISGKDFVDRIFDLSYWHGNKTGGSITTPQQGTNYQRIVMRIKVDNMGTADSLSLNLFVKYVSDPEDVGKRIKYYDDPSLMPKGGLVANSVAGRDAGRTAGVRANDFIYWPVTIQRADLTDGYAWLIIPTPYAYGGGTGLPAGEEPLYGQIEYFGFRSRFAQCQNCAMTYGFRTSAYNADGAAGGSAPSWYPNDNSFIGTGVTRIVSTGVVNNTKKTIEIAVYKDIYVDILNTGGKGYERCATVPDSVSSDIRNCNLKIYRQIKY